MRTGDRSAANIERRADELLDAQRLRANGGTDDIHDSVGRTDFVKMDVLDPDVVNLGFRCTRGQGKCRWPSAWLAR